MQSSVWLFWAINSFLVMGDGSLGGRMGSVGEQGLAMAAAHKICIIAKEKVDRASDLT